MSQARQTCRLLFCVTLMGLTACSAITSAADQPSAACTEKVKGQVEALTQKNGRNPSRNAEENLLAKCAEAEVGLQLEGLFAKHSKESLGEKEARCQTSVKFVQTQGLEKNGRSTEELVKVCMGLPSEHEVSCGFPVSPEEYSVRENQQCVSKRAGLTARVMAKAEKRVRKFDGQGTGSQGSSGDEGGDGSATGAQ